MCTPSNQPNQPTDTGSTFSHTLGIVIEKTCGIIHTRTLSNRVNPVSSSSTCNAAPVGTPPEGLAEPICQHGPLQAVLAFGLLGDVDAPLLEIGKVSPAFGKQQRSKYKVSLNRSTQAKKVTLFRR